MLNNSHDYNNKTQDHNNINLESPNSFLKSHYGQKQEERNEKDYDDSILKLILRRKKELVSGFLVVFLLLLGLTAVQRITRPKYESRFQLLISDPTQDDSGRSSSGSNAASQFLGLANRADVATLISVLQSRSILLPVVKDFSQTLPKNSKEKKDFDLTWEDFIAGKSKKSPLNILQERGARYQDVNVLQISYEGYDPKIAKVFLEKVSQAYIKYSIEQKRLKISQGINFLNQEYPILEKKLESVEQSLKLFQQKYKLIDPLEQARFVIAQINTTQNVLDNLRTQIAIVRQSLQTITEQYRVNFSLTSQLDNELSNSSRYQSLLDKLLEVNEKLAEAKALYTAESPTLALLSDQKKEIENLLSEESNKIVGQKLNKNDLKIWGNQSRITKDFFDRYRSDYLQYISLKTEIESQQSMLANLKQQYNQLPELVKRYTSLQRKYEVANKNLINFIETRERLRLDLAQRITAWEIVAEPVLNTEPISPNLLLNLVYAVMAGLGFGLFYAYIYDKYDSIFHSAQEIYDYFDMPILAEIPYNKYLKGIKGKSHSNSLLNLLDFRNPEVRISGEKEVHFYHESFTNLYSNLEFLNVDTRLKSLCFTSTTPSEGKSTISIFAAQRFAEFGHRVLLVDTDLRRPQIHERLNLPNFKGLSNLVVNDLDINQVIQSISANLFVLTSGPIPPDPSLILSSERIKLLMNQFYQQFDYIIYDCPPLIGLSDTYFFASQIDSLIWVVSLGKVERQDALQAFKSMKFRKLNLSGCVVNCLRPTYQTTAASSYYAYYKKTDSNLSKIKQIK